MENEVMCYKFRSHSEGERPPVTPRRSRKSLQEEPLCKAELTQGEEGQSERRDTRVNWRKCDHGEGISTTPGV